jgi:lysophospholipase L1-like esterase
MPRREPLPASSPGRLAGAGRRRLATALIAVVAAAVGLALAEGLLRWLRPDLRADRYFVFPPGLDMVVEVRDDVLPGVRGSARFVTSAQGLRADPLTSDREYLILALGGSSTEGLFLDQEEAWPRLLERQLAGLGAPRVWVGNAGRSGLTSRDHVLQLEHLLPQLPRLNAIMLLGGFNDLIIRLAQGSAYDPRFFDREENRARELRKAFVIVPFERPGALEALSLWRLATARRPKNPSLHSIENYPKWRDQRARARRLIETLPDLGPALDEYRRNLNEIVQLSRARAIRLLLLTEPVLWRDGLAPEDQRLLWMGGNGDFMRKQVDDYYSIGVLAKGMQLYNQVLSDLCDEQHLECVDAAALLPRSREVFYDDCHFNENGARLLAGIVASHFASRPPWAGRP